MRTTPDGVEGAAVEWRRSGRVSVGGASGAPEEEAGASSLFAPGLLLRAKVSGLTKDDLLVLGGGRAHAVTNEAASLKAGTETKRGAAATSEEGAADLRVSAAVSAEGELTAVLPMRLNASALSGLVVVAAGGKGSPAGSRQPSPSTVRTLARRPRRFL